MTTIWTHHDPDGLISAYLLNKKLNARISVTEEFGDVSKWKDGDWMTDMRPSSPSINGTVIDHHPNHPTISQRKYKLIWGEEPASLLVWKYAKDDIPKHEWWKVVIGVVGDGQPEKIPYEVWKSQPDLLGRISTYIGKSYGDWKVSTYPVYKLLSSSINAFCRYGEYDAALKLIETAKSPFDIINSDDANKKKEQLKHDFEEVMHNAVIHEFGNLLVVIFESPVVRLSGYVASVLGNEKTVLAINATNGRLSMRGDLALYYQGKFKDIKYLEMDGHPGFFGGKITKPVKDFISDLMNLL